MIFIPLSAVDLVNNYAILRNSQVDSMVSIRSIKPENPGISCQFPSIWSLLGLLWIAFGPFLI